METIKMKSSWDDITLADLMRIREIGDLQMITEDEKNLKVAAFLAGIEYEKILMIPLNEVRQYMDNTEFLLHEIKPIKAKRHYTVNGRRYNLFKDAAEMTVAQYIDFQSIYQEGFDKRPAEMLSIFLIPDGHIYNDGYDKEEVVNDMYDMSVREALGVADFFTKRYVRLIRSILVLLKIRMKWMVLVARKKDKEMMKALELEMRLVLEKLECIYGSLQSKR